MLFIADQDVQPPSMFVPVAKISIGANVIAVKVVETKIINVNVQMNKQEIERRVGLKNDKKHETKQLEINGKLVEIDFDMVPLVRWMNSLDAVETLYCCHGDYYKKGKFASPYLLFYCYDMSVYEYIASITQSSNIQGKNFQITIDSWWIKSYGLRFKMNFYDRLALQDFNKKLKKIKIPSTYKVSNV